MLLPSLLGGSSKGSLVRLRLRAWTSTALYLKIRSILCARSASRKTTRLPHADLQKILMDGEAIGAVVCRAMRGQIGFHVAPGWRPADGQKVEHEFGNGIGGGGIRSDDICRVEAADDLIAVAMLPAELCDEAVEIEAVAEEMVQHRHAVGAAILYHDDRHAGRRHPGHELLEMREPFARGNVIQGMGAEDKIALGFRIGGENRRTDGLGLRDRLPELVQ